MVPIHNRRATIAERTPDRDQCCSTESVKKKAVETWHGRLEHTNMLVVRDMIAAGKYGMNSSSQKNQVLETCLETKYTKVTCKGNLVEGFRAATVHAKVCDPMQHQGLGGCKFFVVLIGAPHRCVRVRCMKSRMEVQKDCLDFIS